MSKCLTCKYATPDGLCLAKGKFTVLDADACETYAPIMEHELAALRRENAKLRELVQGLWFVAQYLGMDSDGATGSGFARQMRELGAEV